MGKKKGKRDQKKKDAAPPPAAPPPAAPSKPKMVTLTLTTDGDRHCAYCLDPIDEENVVRCEHCFRRAYCGEACRMLDWTDEQPSDYNQQIGQGHKNWCSLRCGEEDLDWIVTPVGEKGLGIIALKEFPKGARIMVDGAQPGPYCHSKMKTLMPGGEGMAMMEDKWALNHLTCGYDDAEDMVLSMKIARANHSCRPNADHFYDDRRRVKILYAVRDIKKGEEITYSYLNYTNFGAIDVLNRHLILKMRWGVECPRNSPCQNALFMKKIEEGCQLQKTLPMQINDPCSVGQALRGVQKLLQICDDTGVPQLNKKAILYEAFQIAIKRRNTLADARRYIKEICDMCESIMHPDDPRLHQFQEWKKDIRKHHFYLDSEPIGRQLFRKGVRGKESYLLV